MNALNEYLLFNKIKTGIAGFDALLFKGLVIPENENMMIVIRGDDNTEKTILSLQLIHGIAQTFKKVCKSSRIHYFCNYLNKEYIEDLFLDMLIASSIQLLIKYKLQGNEVKGSNFTKSFFDTNQILRNQYDENHSITFPDDCINNPDEMLCSEALYYNNRTNALHLRISHQDSNTSNEKNAVFKRKCDIFEDIKNNKLSEIENLLNIKFIETDIKDKESNLLCIATELDKIKNKEYSLACVNIVNDNDPTLSIHNINNIIDNLKKFKLSILVIRDDIKIPQEKADMIIDLTTDKYCNYNYILNYLQIFKSRFQSTAIGRHQYKRRDYGIEVYPSLHLYCQQRRYLQRALIYTHSNVISETFQQYLDKSDKNSIANYTDYKNELADISKGYFNALSPTAYKNSSILNVLDTVLINPIKNVTLNGDALSEQMKLENDFLYGNNGGITAIIGEPNTYKRFITFGSAFSSAYKKEHTLFLLLNKDDKIVRRRLQCPARHHKTCSDMCQNCYDYLHFMNIMLGCITPEEFLYFLFQQIDTTYNGKEIKRIIIDDLQIIEYCFPFLLQEPLFIPALVDECRDRKIALYILCDKDSRMAGELRTISDNVICTQRNSKGFFELYVERYSGYNSKPSKIFAGKVQNMEDLFECYEQGSYGNRQTRFEINPNAIDDINIYTMTNYWNRK